MELKTKLAFCWNILKSSHIKETKVFQEGYKAGLFDNLLDNETFNRLKTYSEKISKEKDDYTLGDWVKEYGRGETEEGFVLFGSWQALGAMITAYEKVLIRQVLSLIIDNKKS